MVSAPEIVSLLAARGVRMFVDEAGTLKTAGPRGAITPDLADQIRQHRDALVDLLAGDAHHAMVADACRVFPGSRILDGAESYFDAFRDLAQEHYPDLAPWDRLDMAFRGLAQIIGILAARGDALGEARARAVWFLMAEFCDRHRGVAL